MDFEILCKWSYSCFSKLHFKLSAISHEAFGSSYPLVTELIEKVQILVTLTYEDTFSSDSRNNVASHKTEVLVLAQWANLDYTR